jgi:rhodanese-related sulfurtransferase
MPLTHLSALQLQDKIQTDDDLLLLDVREPHEFDYAHIDGSKLIPLSLLPLRLNELNQDQEIVVICHHGVRSMQGCMFLDRSGFSKLYNLTGGIDAWSQECDSLVPRY